MMRLRPRWTTPRRRAVPVGRFDAGRWVEVDAMGAVECDTLTVTTYNIWFDAFHASVRHRTIAASLSDRTPDVMVFQEVTPSALDIFLAQPWIREGYVRAAVTGRDVGNYGMLMLSRLPVTRVTYQRLPTGQNRGWLRAEFTINGAALEMCCVHLDSGKASSAMRERQLRRIFRDLGPVSDAVVLGDFNMPDAESARIPSSFTDVWPMLRPRDAGYTEDTSINLMRYDMKNKIRQVRFDRVLTKGDRWTATDIELIGTQPISDDLPRVFPSDHFGVQCRLRARNP
jgi:endonuclease/exonuclease/phosphatase family metal-dependent hydrolase